MARDTSDSTEQVEESHEPRECMACRGTGHVISNLGGTPSHVSCPWCEGSGRRVPGIDAQAHWMAERAGSEADHADQPGDPGAADTRSDTSAAGLEPPAAPPDTSQAGAPSAAHDG